MTVLVVYVYWHLNADGVKNWFAGNSARLWKFGRMIYAFCSMHEVEFDECSQKYFGDTCCTDDHFNHAKM